MRGPYRNIIIITPTIKNIVRHAVAGQNAANIFTNFKCHFHVSVILNTQVLAVLCSVSGILFVGKALLFLAVRCNLRPVVNVVL